MTLNRKSQGQGHMERSQLRRSHQGLFPFKVWSLYWLMWPRTNLNAEVNQNVDRQTDRWTDRHHQSISRNGFAIRPKRSNNQKPRWPSLLMDWSKTQICLRSYDDLLNQQTLSTIALKIHEICMKMYQNDKFQIFFKQYDFWMKCNLS